MRVLYGYDRLHLATLEFIECNNKKAAKQKSQTIAKVYCLESWDKLLLSQVNRFMPYGIELGRCSSNSVV